MALRAVVFDFDGVLANTEPLHYRAYREVLAAVDIELTERDYYARYLGYDDLGAFRQIAGDRGRHLDADTLAALVGRKAKMIEQLEREVPVLFPGAGAAVRRLAAVFPLAIASGALRAEIERVLEAAGIARYFAGIVSAEDTALSKPAPDPYLRAVEVLREAVTPVLEASDCVAIEDSRWGLESAHAAGLKTVAVPHSYPASTLAPFADLSIGSLEELDPTRLIQSFGSC